MTQSTSDRPSIDLGPLLEDVLDARHELADQRGMRLASQSELAAARAKLLAALEVYALALTTSGRPMPYRLRDELFLCREIAKRRSY